jgi:hypothetical protein
VDKTVWNYTATLPAWTGAGDRSLINIEFPLIPLSIQESEMREGSCVSNEKRGRYTAWGMQRYVLVFIKLYSAISGAGKPGHLSQTLLSDKLVKGRRIK